MSHLLNLVLNDTRRTLRAMLRMARLMRSNELLADAIPASISLFKAPSFKCVMEEPRVYSIVLASPSGTPRLFRLIMDIYKKVPDAGTDGHIAYAVRDVLIGESPVHMDFRYDWNSSASFVVEGTDVVPDSFWRGVPATPGLYHFRAILRTLDDQTIEMLELSQDLVQSLDARGA